MVSSRQTVHQPVRSSLFNEHGKPCLLLKIPPSFWHERGGQGANTFQYRMLASPLPFQMKEYRLGRVLLCLQRVDAKALVTHRISVEIWKT